MLQEAVVHAEGTLLKRPLFPEAGFSEGKTVLGASAELPAVNESTQASASCLVPDNGQ